MRIFFFFFLYFFSVGVGRVQASTDAWQVVNPSPDVFWEFTENQVVGRAIRVTPISFLLASPDLFPVQENFVWQFSFTPQQGVDHNIVWGFIDPQNYYQLHIMGGGVWVNRFINHQEMLARGVNFSWEQDRKYQIKIQRKKSWVNVWVDGEKILSFLDTTYDPLTSVGRWGFKMAPGMVFPVESVFSDIQFFTEDRFFLPVKLFLQSDPQWSDVVYDHADTWSATPTMSRWGCAVTAMVMILDFHGFHKMPDGGVVTPASLNQWLREQPDGYVAEGLVNWWAVTRLVKQLSDESVDSAHPLPKLEFSVRNAPWKTTAENFIRNGNPVMAQVPGHFTVLHGIYEESGDFVVSDPYYDKHRSSEYESIQSLRLFQPSFTDLSALVVIHDPVQSVQFLKRENGVWREMGENDGLVEWTENIYKTESLEQTAERVFTVIEKPESGEYEVRLSGVSDSVVTPQFLVYSETAALTEIPLSLSKTVQKIHFSFEKKNGAVVTEIFDWDIFLQKLDDFSAQQKISSVILKRLKKIGSEAKKIAESEGSESIEKKQAQQRRIIFYLGNLLNFSADHNDPQATTELQEILQKISESLSRSR